MQLHKMSIYSIGHGEHTVDVIYSSNNQCARCKSGNSNLEYNGFYVQNTRGYNIYLVEYCPVCNMLSLREFLNVPPRLLKNRQLDLTTTPSTRYPESFSKTKFSEEIHTISPKFVEIYNQSEKAEKSGCNEISGMGYRKSLEFLIKDFLIYRKPDEKSEIAQSSLSNAISKIENSRLKTLALKSAWIGNDEAHYVRKQENYSVVELKAFIRAAITYIEAELTFDKADQMLPVKA